MIYFAGQNLLFSLQFQILLAHVTRSVCERLYTTILIFTLDIFRTGHAVTFYFAISLVFCSFSVIFNQANWTTIPTHSSATVYIVYCTTAPFVSTSAFILACKNYFKHLLFRFVEQSFLAAFLKNNPVNVIPRTLFTVITQIKKLK